MKHRSQSIDIPAEKPFTYDELGREHTAENLTNFLKNTDEPIVLSINAEWGQGKTTFIKMWQQMLSNEGFPTLYYSAWENDFNNDALVTIIGEIENKVENILKVDGKKSSQIKQHLNKAKDIGGEILSNSLPFLIKILTSGLIDSEKIDSDDIGNLAKNIAQEQIKQYQRSKNQVVEFKRTLTSLAINLKPENEFPLVIFVDELDRCRPSFALEVLERIKHLFSTPNVIFVLAIDKSQLLESIKTVYGQNLNSSGYLKRFIDLEFVLPVPDIPKFSKAIIKTMGLMEFLSSPGLNLNRNDANQVIKNILEIVDYFECTLREVEKCYSKVIYTYKISTLDHDLYPIPLSFLILLNIKFNELYALYRSGQINTDELFNKLAEKSEKMKELTHSEVGARIWAELFVANSQENDLANKINEFSKSIDEDNPSDKSQLDLKRLGYLEYRRTYLGRRYIKYIFQNIELVSSFE